MMGGLGYLPYVYTQNSSECANFIIKHAKTKTSRTCSCICKQNAHNSRKNKCLASHSRIKSELQKDIYTYSHGREGVAEEGGRVDV